MKTCHRPSQHPLWHTHYGACSESRGVSRLCRNLRVALGGKSLSTAPRPRYINAITGHVILVMMGSRTNVVLLVASIMCSLELIMSRSCPLRTCIHSKYSVCFDCQPTWPRISYKHKPKGRREQGLSDLQARVQQLIASQRVQGGKKDPTCYWRAPMTSTCSNCLLICCRWSTLVFGRFCAQHWETQLQLFYSHSSTAT
jgi:hypothetical protein